MENKENFKQYNNGLDIKLMRLHLGYKQEDAAKLIGYTRTSLSKAEIDLERRNEKIWLAISRLPKKTHSRCLTKAK